MRGWLAEAQRAAVNRLVDAADAVPPTIVLPVDQAEELFGAEAGDEAGDFLTVVAAVLRDGTPELPIIVVATVRADRYEPLQTAPQLAGLDARVFDDLKPMPQAQFREVICGPAARAAKSGARLVWAPELVDRLLADCAAGADALPLLSLTLARLYEDYGDGVVGLTEYEAMGGMRRVVETEIDGVLSADPDTRERELKQLHDAFIPWLVAINPANDEPLRRAARWVDLPADSHPLIEALVAKRLLVKDERDGTVVVEVALESLLRQWDTLAGWLRGEAADLKNTDAIEHAARDWEHNARHDDWLLPGERLAEAEALAAKPGFRDRLNASREYLLISRQRENRHADAELQKAHEHARALRRRSQLLMAVLAVTVVAAVVAAVGFVQASHARRDAEARARDATANELVAEAMNQLGNLGRDRDDLAMQLILAARTFPSNNPVEYPIVSALQTERDLLKIIDAHAWVNSVAYSPDGHRIAAAAQGADRTVQIWDADTGQPAGPPLRGHDKHVTSVAYRPDGHRLATASDDKTVRIWDADTGQPIGQPLRGHDDAVNSVAYSRDGHRLATASDDKTVRIWDADTGQPIGQPLRRDDPVWVVAFSPDGHRIASGGADNTVRLWDADTGQPIGEPLSSGQPGLAVTTVAFSPDGHRLAAGGGFDFAVHLFDTDSGQPAGQLSGHTGVVNSVAFSPYGRFIVTGSEDRTVRLWDAQTGQPLGAPFSGHQNAVTSVAFSPDGHRIASGAFDDTVRVWDTITGRPLIGHQDMVTRVAFSPDGHRVASASFDKTVRLWDPQTHQPIGAPLTGHEDWVTCVVYSPDGHRLATASADKTVRIWDADTGQPIGEPLRGHDDAVDSVAFSPDGHRLATASADKTVRIWDADTLAPIGDPLKHDAPVIAAVFSPDGQHIATSSFDATMRLWDTRTGHLLTGPVHHDHQDLQLAFSPDGHRIVAGSWHNTVPIWDAQTLQPSGDPLVFGGGMVAAAAFSPDGTTIAATSNDGTIRLWNAQTGVGFGPALTGHTASVNSVAFSPDSRTIVTGSVDKTLRLWPVPTMSPEALCAKLTQNMSHKVWDYWVANIDYHTQCPGLPIPDDQR